MPLLPRIVNALQTTWLAAVPADVSTANHASVKATAVELPKPSRKLSAATRAAVAAVLSFRPLTRLGLIYLSDRCWLRKHICL